MASKAGKKNEVVCYDSVFWGFILWITMFFLPVWGVVLPLGSVLWCLAAPPWWTWHQTLLMAWLVGLPFVTGIALTVSLKDNRIILGKDTLSFPLYVAQWRKWSDLRLVKLRRPRYKSWFGRFTGDALELYFRDGRIVSLVIKGLSGEGLKTLLGAISSNAPQCRMQLAVKRLETKDERDFANVSGKAARVSVVEIKYSPYQGVRSFIKFLMTYEKYYWRVWLPTILLPIILAAPYIVLACGAYVFQWNIEQKFWSMLDPWNHFLQFLASTVGRGFFEGSQLFYSFVVHPAGAAVLFGVTAIAFVGAVRMIRQPGILLLDKDGLRLGRKILIWRSSTKAFAWDDLKSVKFIKPKGSTMPERWNIGFLTSGSKVFQFKLSGIGASGDRQRLIAAVDRFSPSATFDSELLETLLPSQERSYTELWLTSLSAPPKRERLSPLNEGTTLQSERYRIVRQLGVGGQGVAYLAQLHNFLPGNREAGRNNPDVVLKEFILPVYVDRNVRRQALERFENEAAMLKRLEHKQIVKLLDFFVEDHRGYLVLEHIDGVSLRMLVEREGPPTSKQVAELARQMCDILQYLHSLSPPVVHRDFTPDNLILGRDGVLKLIDFNVAQQRESTTTGTVVGKHAYLPPEQFRGKPTPQSDMYAFGATLFYLLTGQDPEPLTKSHPLLYRQDTSTVLEEIVSSCTELDQVKRTGNAATVREMLDEDDALKLEEMESTGESHVRTEVPSDGASNERDESAGKEGDLSSKEKVMAGKDETEWAVEA